MYSLGAAKFVVGLLSGSGHYRGISATGEKPRGFAIIVRTGGGESFSL
jgi:hypothetical protein